MFTKANYLILKSHLVNDHSEYSVNIHLESENLYYYLALF